MPLRDAESWMTSSTCGLHRFSAEDAVRIILVMIVVQYDNKAS